MICTLASEKIVALLRSPGSHDQQHYAADKCQSPDKGWKRKDLFCVDRGLRGPISITFSRVVLGDALVGERHDAKHDERDAEYRCCFYGHVLSREATQPAFTARCWSLYVRRGRRARARTVVTGRSVCRSAGPADQGQDEQDQENYAQSPAGAISPVCAVPPGGQYAHEQQHQHDNHSEPNKPKNQMNQIPATRREILDYKTLKALPQGPYTLRP